MPARRPTWEPSKAGFRLPQRPCARVSPGRPSDQSVGCARRRRQRGSAPRRLVNLQRVLAEGHGRRGQYCLDMRGERRLLKAEVLEKGQVRIADDDVPWLTRAVISEALVVDQRVIEAESEAKLCRAQDDVGRLRVLLQEFHYAEVFALPGARQGAGGGGELDSQEQRRSRGEGPTQGLRAAPPVAHPKRSRDGQHRHE